MRYHISTICSSLALLAVVAMPISAQDITGKWVFSVVSPQGPLSIDVTFAQTGTSVSGEADFYMTDDIQISDGVLEDGVLFFLLHVGIEDQWITAEVEGEVEDDRIVGQIYLAEMGSSSFTAKRAEGEGNGG